MARLAAGGRYGFAQSVFQVGGNAGQAISPLLVALLVIPNGQAHIAWFALAAVLGIVLLTRVGYWYRGHLALRRAAKAGPGRVAGRAQPGDRGHRRLLALTFSKNFYMAAFASYYTFFLIDRFAVSVASAQIHLFVFLGAVAVGTLIGGPIGDRIGRKPILWLSILGVLPLSLALPFVEPVLDRRAGGADRPDHGLGLPGDHRLRAGAAARPGRHDRRPVLRLRLRHGRHRRRRGRLARRPAGHRLGVPGLRAAARDRPAGHLPARSRPRGSTRPMTSRVPLFGRPGPVLVATAGIGLLSIMDAAVKHVSAGVPTWEIVLLRYLFGTAFALPLFLAGGLRLPPAEALRAHLLRSVVIVLTAATFFYALSVLPLAVTLALSFTSPIMIAALARLSLGERPTAGVLLAIAIGFLGVLTVLLGELGRSGSATLWGILAATAAAAFYAIAMVSLKARAARDPIATIVLLQNACAALLVAPLGWWVWVPPTSTDLAWFAAVGLLGTAGHVALAWAYGRAEASRMGAIEYTAFVWAAGLGFLFFGEVPSPATLAGAALIIAGAVVAARAGRPGVPLAVEA